MMSERRALTLPMLGLLAMLAGWLTFEAFRPPTSSEVAESIERPRYHIEGAQWHRYDDTGAEVFEARASGIDYFDDASMELTGIELVTRNPGRSGSWQLTADRGSVPAGQKRIELKPAVRIDGEPFAQPAIEIATPTLWADWGERTLSTADPVVARSPGRTLSAIGLRADWNAQRVEFLRQVESRLESSHARPR